MNDKPLHASITSFQCENTTSLRQYYVQSQLDVIHSYLAHSQWKIMVRHFTNQHHIELEECKGEQMVRTNGNKYITEYGFGVVHDHLRLSPKWHSIYDEMTHNTECNLDEAEWRRCLVKAIHKHHIMLNSDHDDKQKLLSKHFSKSYHILRNEPIGIRHVLSLVIYTDISALCTEFRRTYRTEGDQTIEQVTAQHIRFYHLAR
eukprot:160859_1